MDYSDKVVVELMRYYNKLTHALQELDDVKKDKSGAVLGWIATYYQQADDAIEFLRKTASDDLKKELGLGLLEKRLYEFANTRIKL